jgi:hypothetical protein
MKKTLSTIGDFVREVEIRPVAAMSATYHLEFSSRLASARNPLESMKNFDLQLTREELRAFSQMVLQALGDHPAD